MKIVLKYDLHLKLLLLIIILGINNKMPRGAGQLDNKDKKKVIE